MTSAHSAAPAPAETITNLPMKPIVSGMPASENSATAKMAASTRPSRPEPPVVEHLVGVAVAGREHGDDAEGRQRGREVGDEVEADGHAGALAAGEERDQQVAEVGDGGVRQDPLDVVLAQRQQVAGDHGGDGDGGERQEQRRAGVGAHRQQVAQQQGEDGALGDRRHVGGDRRGRALVHVRRPHVERHDGELEAHADEQHDDADGDDDLLRAEAGRDQRGHARRPTSSPPRRRRAPCRRRGTRRWRRRAPGTSPPPRRRPRGGPGRR